MFGTFGIFFILDFQLSLLELKHCTSKLDSVISCFHVMSMTGLAMFQFILFYVFTSVIWMFSFSIFSK